MNNPIPSAPLLAPPPCGVKSSHEWHAFTHHAINPPSHGRCEDPVRCVLLSKAIITEHSTSSPPYHYPTITLPRTMKKFNIKPSSGRIATFSMRDDRTDFYTVPSCATPTQHQPKDTEGRYLY
uniref:Uncharacterized protein n=1 Tax=Anopheles melas TaxID=34690 RepID=A0A182UFV4_9DIPT